MKSSVANSVVVLVSVSLIVISTAGCKTAATPAASGSINSQTAGKATVSSTEGSTVDESDVSDSAASKDGSSPSTDGAAVATAAANSKSTAKTTGSIHDFLEPTAEKAKCLAASTRTTAAEDNYACITYALEKYDYAYLAPDSTFVLNKSIYVRSDDVLTSSAKNPAILELTSPYYEVVSIMGSNSTMSNLIFNYNNQYVSASNPCQAVVLIPGRGHSQLS